MKHHGVRYRVRPPESQEARLQRRVQSRVDHGPAPHGLEVPVRGVPTEGPEHDADAVLLPPRPAAAARGGRRAERGEDDGGGAGGRGRVVAVATADDGPPARRRRRGPPPVPAAPQRTEEDHEGVEGRELQHRTVRERRHAAQDDGRHALGLGARAVDRVLEYRRQRLEADELSFVVCRCCFFVTLRSIGMDDGIVGCVDWGGPKGTAKVKGERT